MNELGELELRILAVLEELGHENIPAMMNTILAPSGGLDEIKKIQASISILVDASMVDIQMSSQPTGFVPLSKSDAIIEITNLQQHLQFAESRKRWTDDRMSGPPYFQVPIPEIIHTDAGLQRGIAVLDQRGYQWWRQRG